jgi:RecB family exonuclease
MTITEEIKHALLPYVQDGIITPEFEGLIQQAVLAGKAPEFRILRPIVLNQSSYKDFQNCQRLFAWKRVEGLEPVGRRSALEIGTATHTGLAVFHSTRDPDLALEAARKKLEERAGPSTRFEDKDLDEAQAIVDSILPAYIAHYSKTEEIWTPLNQEIEFLVEVGDRTNVHLRGKSDNLSTAKGGLYLVDYKTAGRMDPRDLLKYDLEVQLSAYIYGLTKHLTQESLKQGGEPVVIRGAIIDVLVKTKVPQFARELFTRSVAELQEFETEFVEVGSRIRAQLARVAAGESMRKVFPKNTEHCFRYGTCPFRDLCLKDTPVRRALYNKRDPDYVDEAQADLDTAFKEGRV